MAVIVTTSRQTDGLTRSGKKGWDFFDQALAASFVLAPNAYPTATAIEVGLLVSDFFKESFGKNIGLKWPNDLIYRGSKCGGIVMKLVGRSIVCGLGINLIGSPEQKRPYKAGHLFDHPPRPPFEMALDIYRYILEHRQEEASVICQKFAQKCVHLGKETALQHGEDDKMKGIFLGINTRGGAILQTIDGEEVVYFGHLRY